MSSIILEAKSLTKEYKQTLALDHINLQIKKGKIYGFIGQNGAGVSIILPIRLRCFCNSSVPEFPHKESVPLVGNASPVTNLKKVVLPAPF